MTAAEFAELLPKRPRRRGEWWDGLCPGHEDHSASLSFTDGDRRLILKCRAGCTDDRILKALNLDLSALFHNNGHRASPVISTIYDYCDERGALRYQNVRYEPKDFRMRRPDGRGGWAWTMAGVRRVVYRLPELAEASRVYHVEGEKCADALVALGLRATTTAGGAQSWRDEFADQVKAAGVAEAIVLPDYDAPGEKYGANVSRGYLARGLRVKVVRLPGLTDHGDVVDWLASGGTRQQLEALVDAAPLFTSADEEPATNEAASDEPELRREGLDLALVWPDGVQFVLTAIREGRDGVRSELTVTRGGRRLSWTAFSLPSAQARETLRKKLEAIAPDVPWAGYLEDAAWRFTQAARQGEPLVTLTGQNISPTRELVPGFLYEGEPTSVIADGETGKSLVALAIAAAVQANVALPSGLKPVRAVPAAFLDWETSLGTVETRLAHVAAGLGIDPPAILYKRMTRPLVDEVAALAPEFARRGIGLVITDSQMFAVASGEGAAFHEPITAFYNALRLFAPAATLVLNHITNEDARHGRAARPFGGAFAFNGPRLIWEAKRDREVTDATAIAFTCIKANNLPRRPDPFGLRFVPGNGTITVYPFDLTEAVPQATAGAPLTYRIRLAIARGVRTADAITKDLDAKPDTVDRILRRLRKDNKARETETGWELVT